MCAKNSSDFMRRLFKCRHEPKFFHAGRIFYLNHNAGGLSRLYVCFFLECTSFYVQSVLMKIKDNIAMHFCFF